MRGARGQLPRQASAPVPSGRSKADRRGPWRPSNSEEEQRLEALQAKILELRDALGELRELKAKLADAVLQAQRAGTRQDRAEELERRLALVENAQVQRVEWCIPDYSELLERCPKGQCVASPSFSAAGIPNMQLLFHPNGNKDAREGYCSLALRVPEGVRLTRTLFVNQEALGPDIVKTVCEGYTNACPVTQPKASVRGTAADVVTVGVCDLMQHGRLADPQLQRVLLVGDAPAAEVNFRLLREMRSARRQREREERQRELEEEQRQRRVLQQEEEERRREAEAEADAAREALAALPAPVTADDVVRQAAVKVVHEAAIAKAEKQETEEERAAREKKEKALAWLLEYQRKQAAEKEEQERQRSEREQVEREVRAEMEKKRREEACFLTRKQKEEDAARQAELEAHAQQEVERRAQALREARLAEEQLRREEELEQQRLDEELRQQEEELRLREEEQRRLAAARQREREEQRLKDEAAARAQREVEDREQEEKRARQEHFRKMEEQRRAFEKAEEDRLRRRKAEEEERQRLVREEEERQQRVRQQAEEEARQQEEEERRAREEEQRRRAEDNARRAVEQKKNREEERRRQEAEERESRLQWRLREAEEEERRERKAIEENPPGGSGMAAGKALRKRAEGAASGVPVAPGAHRGRPATASDSGGSEDEVFDAEHFRRARANVGPSSGSNLRAWALAAAAPLEGGSSGEDSAEDELDWIKQRHALRGGDAGPTSALAAPKLPAMRKSGTVEDDSGSDDEPIFMRR